MSVNYSAGLSPYVNKGKCGMPEKFDNPEVMKQKAKVLARMMMDSKFTVVHTGAGISTAAGIPDFRGPKGVWTLEKNGKEPDCNITFEEATPTYSHEALVELEKQGLVNHVISQNIDGLHLKSKFPISKLSELHGNMFTRKCNLCLKEQVKDNVSPTMALRFTGEKCCANKSRGGKCRGKLKDTILDWEDSLPDSHLDAAERACKQSELAITLGTSLQILPAANLPLLTKKAGGKLVIINLQPTKHDKKADLRIYAFIDDVFKQLMEIISIEKENKSKKNVLKHDLNSNGNNDDPISQSDIKIENKRLKLENES